MLELIHAEHLDMYLVHIKCPINVAAIVTAAIAKGLILSSPFLVFATPSNVHSSHVELLVVTRNYHSLLSLRAFAYASIW